MNINKLFHFLVRILALSCLLQVTSSCSLGKSSLKTKQRPPLNEERKTASIEHDKFSYAYILEKMGKTLLDQIKNPDQCSDIIRPLNGYFSHYPNKLSDIYIKNKHEYEKALKTSFYVQLILKEKVFPITDDYIKNYYQTEIPGFSLEELQVCQTQITELLINLESLDDLLIEKYYAATNTQNLISPALFSRDGAETLINPMFKNFDLLEDLKPGDIILSKSLDTREHFLASMFNNNLSYFNAGMIYIDQSTQEKFVIETTLDNVTNLVSFNEFLAREYVSLKILRFSSESFNKDDENGSENIAIQASEILKNRIKQLQTSKINSDYDYLMNIDNEELLSPGELIIKGFKIASKGDLNESRYASLLSHQFNSIIEKLDKNAGTGDMENLKPFLSWELLHNPDFQTIAKWTNPILIGDFRLKTHIAHKIASWIENEHYKVKFKNIKLKSGLPKSRHRKTLKYLEGINLAAMIIYDQLVSYISQQSNTEQNLLNDSETNDWLEIFKASDFERFKNDKKGFPFLKRGNKTHFHYYIRP